MIISSTINWLYKDLPEDDTKKYVDCLSLILALRYLWLWFTEYLNIDSMAQFENPLVFNS